MVTIVDNNLIFILIILITIDIILLTINIDNVQLVDSFWLFADKDIINLVILLTTIRDINIKELRILYWLSINLANVLLKLFLLIEINNTVVVIITIIKSDNIKDSLLGLFVINVLSIILSVLFLFFKL